MSEYEPKYVVVNMVEEAEKLVTKFEIDTVTKFTIFSRNKGFSHDLDCLQGHRVLWEDKGQEEGVKVPCNGTPFIILGFDVRECHFGPDRNTMKKKKYQMEKTIEADQDHSYTQKSRTLVQNTKKLDCPARIYMKKICKFPDYKILGHDSIWKRKKQAQKLKKALSTNEDMLREEEIHIFFPGIESHKNHLTGQRWVWLFRKNLFNIRVSTTNGLERHHLKLKQDYLSQTSDKSLSSLVNVLFSQVFPDSYNRLQCKESRKYQSICFHRPKILKKQTKAPMLVEHYMKRIPPYVQMVNEENIKHGLNGKFQVKSLNSDNVYEVDLYAHYPCCSCPDWQEHHLPCKHMLPIFHHFPAWDWDFLPSDYRDAPRFNLDFELLNQLQEMLPTQPQFPAELATQPEQSTKILGKKRQISKEPEVPLLTNDWQTCRELIKVIQSRVMNSCGQDLSNIVEQLQQVADELKEIEPKDDDLPVIQPLKRKRVSDPNKYGKRKKTVSSLPKQRSKRKLRKNRDKGTKMSATQDTSPDSKTWEKQFNYLMDSERRFKKACEKIVHLNKRMRNLQLRYKKAWVENHRSFRYSIRLRISVVEGLLNMYHNYALIKANIIKDLRHEMFGEDVQIITSDTSDSEDED